jgi:hypothetical protein
MLAIILFLSSSAFNSVQAQSMFDNPGKGNGNNGMNDDGTMQRQTPAEPGTVITGTIKEVTAKSKLFTVVVDDGSGKPHSFILTPKIKLEIMSTGSNADIKENLFVTAKVNQPNETSLVAVELTVHTNPKGKYPAGSVEQAQAVVGESKNNLIVSGKVKSFSTESTFENFDTMVVQLTGGQSATIQIPEKNLKVQLVSSDGAMIKPGDAVEVKGNLLKNGKIIASQLIITPGTGAAAAGTGDGKSMFDTK